jgi:putative membrane protein
MSETLVLARKDYVTRTMIRIIAIVSSIYGMAMSWDSMALTYFTNLSNLMICAALLGSLILDTRSVLKSKSDEQGVQSVQGVQDESAGAWVDSKPNAWYIFKFMMTISIAVTFTLYLCFLAPTNKLGFVGAYMNNGCSSLCVHFITPLLAIFDFVLFDYKYKSSRAHVYFATIPPLTYVAYAVCLSEFAGVRWGEHAMAAPYNFLNYKAPAGWFGFAPNTFNSTTLGVGVVYLLAIFTLIFIGIGIAFLAIKNARAKRLSNQQ